MKERMHDLDVLKGVGIILVVFGHMIPRGTAWNLIYNCHMPLFIFCSGLVTGRRIKWNRLSKILLSYIFLALLGMSVYYCLFEQGNIYYIKQTIFNIFVGGFSPNHGIYPVEALWFLPCLVVTTLLFQLITMIPNCYIRHIAAAVAAVAGAILMEHRNQLPMYFNIDIGLLVLPFFYIAYYYGSNIREKFQKTDVNRVYRVIGSIAVYCICAMLNGEVNIFRGVYGYSLILYYIAGFLGTVCLWQVSSILLGCGRRVANFLQALGQHTLVIMGTHQLVLVVLRHKFSYNDGYELMFMFPLVIAVTLAFSYLLTGAKKAQEGQKA